MTKIKDIIGLTGILEDLEYVFDAFESGYALTDDDFPRGMLIAGHPGCGKTMIIRAMMTDKVCDNVKFVEIGQHNLSSGTVSKTSEIMKAYFDNIRKDSKTMYVLFIDEIESLIPVRTGKTVLAEERTNAFLKEMDGLNPLLNCFIIGTTNAPRKIDNAAIRPGRFDEPVFVKNPNMQERERFVIKYIVDCFKICEWNEENTAQAAKNSKGLNGSDFLGIKQNLTKIYRKGKKNDINFILTIGHINTEIMKKVIVYGKRLNGFHDYWLKECDAST